MEKPFLSWWKVNYYADGTTDYYETLAYTEKEAKYAIEQALKEEGNEKIQIRGAWRLPDASEENDTTR